MALGLYYEDIYTKYQTILQATSTHSSLPAWICSSNGNLMAFWHFSCISFYVLLKFVSVDFPLSRNSLTTIPSSQLLFISL